MIKVGSVVQIKNVRFKEHGRDQFEGKIVVITQIEKFKDYTNIKGNKYHVNTTQRWCFIDEELVLICE